MGELAYFPAWTDGRKNYVKRVYGVFKERLAENGLRLTDQRRRILDFLLKTRRHVSQEDVFLAVRRYGTGRATVFRTLKMLKKCGLVDHVVGNRGKPRFEVNLERPHHDHLICVLCGRIQEVRWPKLEKIQEQTCLDFGFIHKWHRHEIFGRCKNCASL